MGGEASIGVGRIVYGLRKINDYAVQFESGEVLRRPNPLSDCRACPLIGFVCDDLEYPCQAILSKCGRRVDDCTECDGFLECISCTKPCCWECDYLMECLEVAGDAYGKGFVQDRFKCDWEEFVEGVKMLWRGWK